MSTEANKAIAQRAVENFNSGDPAHIDKLYATDYVERSPFAPGLPPNRDGLKQAFKMYRAAFPDAQLTVEDMIAEADKVVVRSTLHGTHQGEFAGIPPTGKRITVTGIDVFRVAGGQIAEHWGVSDSLGMMQQLGVVPQPGAGSS